MIVADASVVLKWFAATEEWAEQALILKEEHVTGKRPIAGPELLAYEVANVLLKKCGRKEAAMEGFKEFCTAEIFLQVMSREEFQTAIEWAALYDLSVYDASYAVVARALRCPLVTADERFLARMKGIPHIVHLKEAVR